QLLVQRRLLPPMPCRPRMKDHAAAQGSLRRLVANDEAIAAHREDRLDERQLTESRLPGADLKVGPYSCVRVQHDERGETLCGADVHSDSLMVLDAGLNGRPDLQKRVESVGCRGDLLVTDDLAPRNRMRVLSAQ